MKRTARGFAIYTEFKDTYNSEVRVQESSGVLPRVWILCTNSPESFKDPSPYLDKKQAIRVAKALMRFAKGA